MLFAKGGTMALPEKLYTLRKKSGLSQEQLAEALNVSRQAISKWEGGSAMPESDKLLALSNYFGVSLDYLLKDGAPDAALIVYGVLSILVPSVPAQISGSSMIRIDGSGIFLLLCVAAIAAGAALLLKSTKHK
jgi:transcriptional regulator with XRE-family HTH domain